MSLAFFFMQHSEEAQEAAHSATQVGTEHAAEAGHAAAAHGGHHTPWIVEQVNLLLKDIVYPIQKSVMVQIDPNWQGDPSNPIPTHVVMAVIAFLICTVGAYLFRGKLSVDNPSNRQQILEGFILQVRDMADQVVGPYGRRYLTVVTSFAFFILISNLMGLVPGLAPPTISINVTLALGVISFVYYISTGFRQQGIHYLKHFTGGLTGVMLATVGPLIFVIEIFGNCVRPVTLGVRLLINIFADEQIAETFTGLVPWVVPSVLLVLAVFVCFVQTFIFVMLSLIYLSETVPHDDHGHEGHGEEAHAH